MRQFILNLMLMLTVSMGAKAQSYMKETNQPIVDVHVHNVQPSFLNALRSHNALMDEGFPIPAWDVESQLKTMTYAGIDCAVLSMPAPQPYFGDGKECAAIIRQYNEETAALCREHPDRFLFCASLPLPDVSRSLKEAVYALDTLHAVGIKLATNSRGQYLGDPALDPLMQLLNDRHAVVMLHPHKPVPVNDSLMKTTPLALYEYPAETTRAIVNLLVHRVPERYPDIKFVIPHCGSFLPLALPRMKAVCQVAVKAGKMKAIDFEGSLRSFYYDLAGGFTPDVLRTMLSITTPDHLLYGSDYPYVKTVKQAKDDILSVLGSMGYGDEMQADIMGGNALRLFTKSEEKPANNPVPTAQVEKQPMQVDGIIRLSRIEVYPEYLDEYMKFAMEVGAVSLKTEPGVLTMYAVAEKDNPCIITILETYASQAAYRNHIQSAHFQKYKQGTLKMVKDLKLIDQKPLNPANQLKNFIK